MIVRASMKSWDHGLKISYLIYKAGQGHISLIYEYCSTDADWFVHMKGFTASRPLDPAVPGISGQRGPALQPLLDHIWVKKYEDKVSRTGLPRSED